jgi:6-phosphofructokinase 1
MIRSTPANPHDSGFCLVLGHNAVHAVIAGRTNMMVGNWKGDFTHVPIRLAVCQRKLIDPQDCLWNNVLAVTGPPREM